jgi:hypothetical protein
MPFEHPAELLMLIPDRPVPHCAALLIDRFLSASQAILRRQLPRYRPALPRFHPNMHEPEEMLFTTFPRTCVARAYVVLNLQEAR